MTVEYRNTAIVKYLSQQSSLYFGKIQELREIVQGWLSYVPQTFPHYTRHTIEHSEEIILQISKMLFHEEDPSRPSVPLSAVEVYILIVSAYLHDAGMVASDREKIEILNSDTWKNWTRGDTGGAKRWTEIESFRRGSAPVDDALRNFIADIQTRFLIAEFIRRHHHLRAADVIQQHQSTLGQFAFSDLQLQEAISNVCIGHGLLRHEMEDAQKYPERRDIRGEPANIRFLAILFRLGDLLDMSYDRACPLLMNSACPLPSDSLAHWSQYVRITHRLTAPDTIEISAACETQDEHRILHDWCQWLVDEAENAAIVMSKAHRHRSWRPPHVSLNEPKQTISIRPSPNASYFPSKWMLEFDRDAIMQRLIYEVHNHPILFILELIQNALDASRSKMYVDLVQQGIEPPEYPTKVNEEVRRQYPVSINLTLTEVKNELSGEIEKKQVLSIEDYGIGMDKNIIERYFLQIGRSYYTSDEYRRLCLFVPISRFGIGFLSVFAVSDRIVVETYKQQSSQTSEPIRITLTGPRSYLLSERGTRRTSGTRIDVLLREPIAPNEIVTAIKRWCRMVEFPIIVSDGIGNTTYVESERPEQFTHELPDITEEGAKFVVRSFPIDRPPISGNLFVFSHLSKTGERWDRWAWSRHTYSQKHPAASTPPFTSDLYCFHGITERNIPNEYNRGPTAVRIDYRGIYEKQNLSRQTSFIGHRRSPLNSTSEKEIAKRWEEILTEHLSSSADALSEDGWKYKQRLVSSFPLPSFWRKVPGTVRLHINGATQCSDLASVLGIEVFRVILPGAVANAKQHELPLLETSILTDMDIASITEEDLLDLSEQHRAEIFTGRSISRIARTSHGGLEVFWELGDSSEPLRLGTTPNRPIEVTALPEADRIGYRIHKTTGSVYKHCVMNAGHPFVQWVVSIWKQSIAGDNFIDGPKFEALLSLIRNPLEYEGHELSKLQNYVEKWREVPTLQPELYPPEIQLSKDMFHFGPTPRASIEVVSPGRTGVADLARYIELEGQEERYEAFHQALLTAFANKDNAVAKKLGDGRFRGSGEDLFDVIVEMGGLRVGASAFQRCAIDGEFTSYLLQVTRALISSLIYHVFIVVDSKPDEEQTIQQIVKDGLSLFKDDPQDHITIICGDIPDIEAAVRAIDVSKPSFRRTLNSNA